MRLHCGRGINGAGGLVGYPSRDAGTSENILLTISNFNMKGRKTNKQRGGRQQPPQLPTNVRVRHTFRFRSTSATATVITDTNLVDMCGGIGIIANTAIAQLALSAKLHSVSVWTPPASQGASATCSVEWASSSYSPQLEVSDTTISTAIPAHIRATPPPGSAAAFWMGQGGNAMFTLTAPTASIIDVDVSFLLNDSGAAASNYTAAAVTLGVLYYLPLDGATDRFLPVSLVTTT